MRLALPKWQQLMVLMLKNGRLSFNNQRIFDSRNYFYSTIKLLINNFLVVKIDENGKEKFYTLTMDGRILAWLIQNIK